ncbi:hypothetical protein X975_17736, partial [Stegodyphus mimosarum]
MNKKKGSSYLFTFLSCIFLYLMFLYFQCIHILHSGLVLILHIITMNV